MRLTAAYSGGARQTLGRPLGGALPGIPSLHSRAGSIRHRDSPEMRVEADDQRARHRGDLRKHSADRSQLRLKSSHGTTRTDESHCPVKPDEWR